MMNTLVQQSTILKINNKKRWIKDLSLIKELLPLATDEEF